MTHQPTGSVPAPAATPPASARTSRRLRLLLIVIVVLIAIAEVTAVYVVLPGRVPATFTALQPDSITYVCHGLQLSWLDPASAARISGSLFAHFGVDPATCSSVDPHMPWQVISRPLLPGLIAVSTSSLRTGWAAALPSIAIFAIFVAVWLWVVRASTARPRLLDWAAAVGPFAATTMILWPAAILTEGPVVVFSLIAVIAIAAGRAGARARSLLPGVVLALVGVALLLTRQSWPIVGALWTAGLMQAVISRRGAGRDDVTGAVPIGTGTGRIGARTAILAAGCLALGYGFAIACARLLETWLVPAGLKERQPYVPEGLVIADLPLVIWSSITSTANDLVIAVSRGDLISPALLVAGLFALAVLVRRRSWALAFTCTVAWALGFYAVGLVLVVDDASRTHLRFLVPAVLMSIAAVLVSRRPPSQATPSRH